MRTPSAPAVGAAVSDTYPLFRSLEAARTALATETWGTWSGITDMDNGAVMYCEYGEDGEGQFATIGFVLPDEFYAEIDGGAYGNLFGFRIYREDIAR